MKDDKFVLMTNSNLNSKVAVRTPWGDFTKRVDIEAIEMQGTVLAPLKCSNQIDIVGKESLEANESNYKYKDCPFQFCPWWMIYCQYPNVANLQLK